MSSLDGVKSRFVNVDGIRTHYLEAGDGPVVVLLHSGEFGAAAEISWEFNIGPLSQHFRVIAPDWLGFGYTDKIFDFSSGNAAGAFARRLEHMRRFLEVISIDEADFVGNSMSAGLLLEMTTREKPLLPVRRQVIISGGGAATVNDARRAVLEYDCTPEAMKRILQAIFVEEALIDNEDYIKRRVEMSMVPGAWQCSAAARFRMPGEDGTSAAPANRLASAPLENIRVPTLLIAGEKDRLRPLEDMQDFHRRIPDSKLIVLPNTGHCSNIERPDEVNSAVIGFFSEPAPAE
ncbi:alpha/beta fold hydrolase [Streptomyces blattellae]|uniref:alpha/beta fold hydrolase n=1 Tax=Streptomyces blattellae TaxID=2569855 RepID=UPI0012B843B4|nr:alpha/beta hydrolase [Streptomyces blattellae]